MSPTAMSSNKMRRAMVMVLAAATTMILGGCASSLTGVGGTERFACQAPVGAQCTSISGVYANTHRNNHLLPTHDARTVSFLLEDFARSAQSAAAASPAGTSASAAPTTLPLAAVTASNAALTTSITPTTTGTSPARATLRASPRVVRLWIAPWEDADGDLHEASFVHVVIDTGRWLIERVRPAARSRMDIAIPPVAPSPPTLSPPSSPPALTSEAKPSADLEATEP